MSMTTVMWIFYIIIFFMGASVFSFVNVLIYRIPAQMPFGNERSICPACKHVLNGYDMIPVFSYLILGGRCRFCKVKISVRYPLVEVLGGGLAVFSFYWFGKLEDGSLEGILRAVLVFVLLAVLTAISFIDIDTLEIPNGLVIAVLSCGLVSIVLFPELGIVPRIIGALAISLPMMILALVIAGAFGGGDIKLMAAAGLFLGWRCVIVAFLVAVLTGGIYGIYLLASKKKDRKGQFAFGPFLCVGIAAAVFAGESIIQWYMGFLI